MKDRTSTQMSLRLIRQIIVFMSPHWIVTILYSILPSHIVDRSVE